MKNLRSYLRNLPDEKYEQLKNAVADVLENKRFNRKARRRLQRRWQKVENDR